MSSTPPMFDFPEPAGGAGGLVPGGDRGSSVGGSLGGPFGQVGGGDSSFLRIATWPRESTGLGPLLRAGSAAGRLVINRLDEPLGEIDELLLDVPRGRIAYALMRGGRPAGIDCWFPLPWTALTLDAARQCFVMDASRWAFASAPVLAKERWSTQAPLDWHENVHRFYGARPYWD